MNGLVSLTVILGFIGSVVGHGYLLEPIARGSRWRFNTTALPDYDDNSQFCGGFAVSLKNFKKYRVL
jgi:hypothetical protein